MTLVHRGWRFLSRGTQLDGRTLIIVWLISIGIHALLFWMLFVMPWLMAAPASADDLPVAHTDLIGDLKSAKLSISQLPDLALVNPEALNTTPTLDPQLQEPVTEAGTPRPADMDASLALIGIGTGGADFSKYGLSGGGTPGPTFFNTGGTKATGAKRIVYVVDRSGSMVDTFDFVRRELVKSIGELRRSQKFHVIFFNAGLPVENPPHRLISATPAQKEDFFQFLNSDAVAPQGSTDPHEAMNRAFGVEPDLIFFLTDGEFDPKLLGSLDRWNQDRRVKIFTIAYFSEAGSELLRKIAMDHGGEFRSVTENDLP